MTTSEHEHEAAAPEVLFQRRGRVGHVILNRPKAINALTHGMVLEITAQLRAWASDGAVETVLLTGAGERGLCAGGDIVGLYHSATSGDGSAAAAFWADEYRLDALIARYPKPYVAIMDGIVLGGGIGLSAHGSHRVVTERSRLGLPEVGIGFVPDVGSVWLLSRAPGELGTHLALTGGMVGAGDAIHLGLADSFVPADRLAPLVDALAERPAEAVLGEFGEPAPPAPLPAERDWIDEAYAGDDARTVLRRLESSPLSAARDAAATIGAKSPTSVAVTLLALRRARELSGLEAVLAQDFRAAVHALHAPDFAEGVRAQVIDKDRRPTWSPAQLPAHEEVEHWFDPVPGEPVFGESPIVEGETA